MKTRNTLTFQHNWLKLSRLPLPAKALVTATILIMGVAMLGALGQIIVHDIIPAVLEEQYSKSPKDQEIDTPELTQNEHEEGEAAMRGDLFSELALEEENTPLQPFYQTEQFVWLLKWTHIHLFGMNMIFILMGIVTIFLDMTERSRSWLVVLPFVGVLIDIAAMWLKAYVSPVFFWLHLPGGGMFGAVFGVVSFRALFEMWGVPAIETGTVTPTNRI
jgi:hypothetical protein